MDWYGHLPSFLSSGIVIKFQGEPISGEVKYTGGEFAIIAFHLGNCMRQVGYYDH